MHLKIAEPGRTLRRGGGRFAAVAEARRQQQGGCGNCRGNCRGNSRGREWASHPPGFAVGRRLRKWSFNTKRPLPKSSGSHVTG